MKRQVLEKLNLGGRIKELRKQRGMTLKELAEKTGLSPALLSQVENNLVSPSISTLWNFSESLGLKIGYFFQQETVENEDYVLTRAGLGPRVFPSDLARRAPCQDLAAGLEERAMGPLLVECGEACDFSLKEQGYDGEEFLYVLGGGVVLQYGERNFELNAGDSIYYNAQVPHRVRAGKGARFLSIAYEANRS